MMSNNNKNNSENDNKKQENKKNTEITEDNTGVMKIANPFGRSSLLQRSPSTPFSTPLGKRNDTPQSSGVANATSDVSEMTRGTVHTKQVWQGLTVNTTATVLQTDKEKLKQTKQAEDRAFTELGKRLSTINGVVSNAKNIHKIIRDNLDCIYALYQELKEHREVIRTYPVSEGGSDQRVEKSRVDPKSPIQDVKRKRAKTATTISALETPRLIKNLGETNTPDPQGVTNDWEVVRHRKERRKKQNKGKRGGKKRILRDQGEAIAIKTSSTTSYADVIKEMKRKIDPTAIGVEIKGIRRTKAGELLVKFDKGEGQAEKLKNAIGDTFGDDVKIRSVAKNHIIDMRDLDESTEVDDLINALMVATNSDVQTSFRILNVRDSFGGTKQALVQLPEHLAAPLLRAGRIKVGWVMCRVRTKTKPKQCYRCMDRGHIASQCKGVDRGKICRKCCTPGHKSRECAAEPKCVICQEAGLTNTQHMIGSAVCVSNRRGKIFQ